MLFSSQVVGWQRQSLTIARALEQMSKPGKYLAAMGNVIAVHIGPHWLWSDKTAMGKCDSYELQLTGSLPIGFAVESWVDMRRDRGCPVCAGLLRSLQRNKSYKGYSRMLMLYPWSPFEGPPPPQGYPLSALCSMDWRRAALFRMLLLLLKSSTCATTMVVVEVCVVVSDLSVFL